MNYGRYEVIKEVGRGSMGVVYEAQDPQIGRIVALKVLRQDRVSDDALVKRFIREARAIGRLSHPHIVAVYDVGEEQGNVYIAMEFLEGRPLDELIRERTFTPEESISIGQQVAETLHYAHGKGVVHRDIKPSNIILQPDGQVKITDFGIAHIDDATATLQTQAGDIMGTPAYMSPEQVLGKPVDGRTDIFSLGVILYELITGKRPFGGAGKTLASVFNEIITENPVEPDKAASSQPLPEGISSVIMTCLAKSPDGRYRTGHDLAQALMKPGTVVVPQAPPQVPPVTARTVPPKKKSSAPFVIAMILLCLIAAAGATAVAVGLYYHYKDGLPASTGTEDKSAFATVNIDSTPSVANLFVDDQPKGTTPAVIQVTPGSHRIRLSLPGYIDQKGVVQIAEAKQYRVSMILTPVAAKGQRRQQQPQQQPLPAQQNTGGQQ